MPLLIHRLLREREEEARKRVFAHFGIDSVDADARTRKRAARLLLPYLRGLTAQDLEKLGEDALELPSVLAEVGSAVERDSILERWHTVAGTDPRFAIVLLGALGKDLVRHPALRAEVQSVLLPVAIRCADRTDNSASALRRSLALHYGEILQGHPQLANAYKQDLERETVARERARQHYAEKERERMAKLDAEQRVRDAEKEARRHAWNEVIALRREAREKERRALAKSLEGMSFLGQLEHLASATIPAGKYPASLAERASASASSVPDDLRARLLLRLTGQRRGVWRTLRDALKHL